KRRSNTLASWSRLGAGASARYRSESRQLVALNSIAGPTRSQLWSSRGSGCVLVTVTGSAMRRIKRSIWRIAATISGMAWLSGMDGRRVAMIWSLLHLGVVNSGLLLRGSLCCVVLAAPRGPTRSCDMTFEHLEARRERRLILLRELGRKSGENPWFENARQRWLAEHLEESRRRSPKQRSLH